VGKKAPVLDADVDKTFLSSRRGVRVLSRHRKVLLKDFVPLTASLLYWEFRTLLGYEVVNCPHKVYFVFNHGKSLDRRRSPLRERPLQC
jgi:hypothetical protein